MTGMVLLLLLGYWPLPANYGISGTFMEYRNQHLHAGFDLSTNGKVGFPIHCFDDGKIVMLKVQKRGYGRVLYIRHPKRKLVSVYGHLDRFTPRLEKIVSRYIKLRHSRYPGTIVPRKPIPVQKGQVIAYSGESGVGWPHLHFELRNLQNEPVNPTNFGLSVNQDKSAPEFQFLNLYPETPSSTVNGHCRFVRLPVRHSKDGNFIVKPFRISGRVLMSVTIRDTDGRKGPLAIQRIIARLNHHPFYDYQAQVFSFDRFNRSSAVYDLTQTRLSPSTYGFNLFRIPGSDLQSQKQYPTTLQKGQNLMQVSAIDFAGHKVKLNLRFHWQGPSAQPVIPTTLTTASVLLHGQILHAASIHQPVSVPIADTDWTVMSYGLKPSTIRLGNVTIEAKGYNTSPRLIYARFVSKLPEETGLLIVPDTGIEIQPGQIFLSQLNLVMHWKVADIRMGWFRYDDVKKKWKYRETELNDTEHNANAEDFRNGTYAVFLDTASPVIHNNPYFFRNRTAWHITDVGKGVDDSTIILSRGKKTWKMQYDPDRKIAWIDRHLRKGRYKIRVTDIAGNTSSAIGRLH
jgi:hypothetical protein